MSMPMRAVLRDGDDGATRACCGDDEDEDECGATIARRDDDDEQPLALRSAWTLRSNFRQPIRTRRYGTDECVLTPPPW
jgi:hypothetical protein